VVLSIDFSSCFFGVVVWCCDRVVFCVIVDCFVFLFLCYGMSLPKIRCLVIVRLSFSCLVLSAEIVDVEFLCGVRVFSFVDYNIYASPHLGSSALFCLLPHICIYRHILIDVHIIINIRIRYTGEADQNNV